MEPQTTPNEQGILFADISDSSRYFRTLGDRRASIILRAFLMTLERVVQANGGRVVDRIGDEIFCQFPTLDLLVRGAVLLQRAAAQFGRKNEEVKDISLRMGLYFGSVTQTQDRPSGVKVYLTKRLTNEAKGGQILLLEETAKRVNASDHYLFRFLDEARLKGQSGSMRLFELVWNEAESTLQINAPAPDPVPQQLALRFGQSSCQLEGDGQWTIGRSGICDIAIHCPGVSRLHARLIARKGRFQIIDQSTNGTYLQLHQTPVRVLHREQAELATQGCLGLGQAPLDGQPHTIVFECIGGES